MDVLGLFEDAFLARGNAVAVIACPDEHGEPVITYANEPFARLLRPGRGGMAGTPLAALQKRVEREADWEALLRAVAGRANLSLDMALHGDQQAWFGFQLTFRNDPAAKCGYGVIVGRDITAARRVSHEQSETRRLLAAVFLRMSAPVCIVNSDGSILMANPAFQELLDYPAQEVQGLNVSCLTPQAYQAKAQAARTKQLQDGARYEMYMDTLRKSGALVPVLLTSVLLHDADQRLRVVTLIPQSALPQTGPPGETMAPPPPPRSLGQIETISMSAFRAQFGADWPKIAVRAMLTGEKAIRRRIGSGDTLSRTGAGDFVIWFESSDEDRNEATVADMVRDVRLRLLADFGDGLIHRAAMR